MGGKLMSDFQQFMAKCGFITKVNPLYQILFLLGQFALNTIYFIITIAISLITQHSKDRGYSQTLKQFLSN